MNVDYSEAPVVRAELQRELDHLRELLREKDVALNLQRVEYHRRLEELNNAHARAEKAVLATVPRETFDVFVGANNKWRDEMSRSIVSIQSSSAANSRIFFAVVALLGLALSALAIWVKAGP